MTPKQAWGILSMVAVALVATAVGLLVIAGLEQLPTVLFGGLALLLYFYILYKRYHVEVVPESDVMLFEDKEDLRILCDIYGLETAGSRIDLRKRLTSFAKAHKSESFTWVAPRAVLALGATLTAAEREPLPQVSVLDQLLKETDEETVRTRGLVFDQPRTGMKAHSLKACPICETKAPRSKTICPECGADLEFYVSLSETKVGKQIVERKARAMRKLRQEVPPLAGR